MTEKRSRMGIQKKLLLSYFSIVALIIVIGIIGIHNVREVYFNGNEIYINNLKSVEYLKSINQNVKEIDQCVVSMMSDLNLIYHKDYIERIAKLQEDNKNIMEQYSKLEITDLERRRYNQCRLSILTFDKQIFNIVEYIDRGDMEGALGAYKQELLPAKACTYELVEAVVELSTANAQSKNEENRRIHENLIWMIGITMAAAVIVAVFITVRMSNYFTGKLAAIQRLAKRISEYNISDDIQEIDNDEFGETVKALNESQFMMRDLMEKIIDESAMLSDTGEEVSLAVRKSGQRIENINVKVLQLGELEEYIETTLKQILERNISDNDMGVLLNPVLDKLVAARDNLIDIRSELSSIAMYLEQIGITSDYQNEIANSHKKQVKKFKV